MKKDLVIVLAPDSFKESMTAKEKYSGNGKKKQEVRISIVC